MSHSSKLVIRLNLTRENLLNTFVSIIVLVLLVVNILTFYAYIPGSIGNVLYLLLGVFSISVCCFFNGIKKQNNYIIFILFYSAFGILSFIYNSNAELIEILWPLGFMGIGLLLLNYNMKPKLLQICFYIFCLFSIFSIYVSGSSRLINTQTSRNNISVYALVYLCLYMMSCYKNKEDISVLPAIIYLITCVLATGRGGIISSGILLFLTFVFDMKKGRSKRRKIGIFIVVIALAILIFLIFNSYFESFISFSIAQFKERGMSSSRSEIWRDYINVTKSSFFNIIFGSHISGTKMLDTFSTNLHNSFFMLHAKYGIGGLILVIWMIVKAIHFFRKEHNMYYIIPFITVLVRMMLDYTNFNGILDIVLINIILYRFYYVGEWNYEE